MKKNRSVNSAFSPLHWAEPKIGSAPVLYSSVHDLTCNEWLWIKPKILGTLLRLQSGFILVTWNFAWNLSHSTALLFICWKLFTRAVNCGDWTSFITQALETCSELQLNFPLIIILWCWPPVNIQFIFFGYFARGPERATYWDKQPSCSQFHLWFFKRLQIM